jgi:DNA-binding response OmpR family regulator
MILDPASMTISHEGRVWEPNGQLARLVVAMSSQCGRIWSRATLLGVMASSANLPIHVDTQIKLVRRAFRERGWPDPITSRRGLGYAWTLPVSEPPVALAGEADEFRFRKA